MTLSEAMPRLFRPGVLPAHIMVYVRNPSQDPTSDAWHIDVFYSHTQEECDRILAMARAFAEGWMQCREAAAQAGKDDLVLRDIFVRV
jgi:hypothetical protein